MRSAIQKWGNSLALRIPKSLAEDTGLRQGVAVELTLEHGRLVAAPVRRPRYALGALLRGVTARNRHKETNTGPLKGREVW